MTIAPAYRYSAVLSRVVDADTLELIVDLGFRVYHRGPIRLHGLDCPELSTPEGRAARDWVRGWCVSHHPLLVETFKSPEKYGRWLGVVMADDESHEVLNDALIAAGHARPYEGGPR